VRRSFALVRRNFFASVGLLLLIWLIGLGLGLLWDQLSSSPVGLIIASVGSAYIGAGLAAARMVFYRERTP
jgi:hypothetical protein